MTRRRGRKRKPQAPKRPTRLGPYGEGVVIDWSDHAAQRARERLEARGLSAEDIDAHFRSPAGKKRDEVDPDFDDRLRRWSHCTTEGQRFVIRYSYLVADDTPPGRVIMITVSRDL